MAFDRFLIAPINGGLQRDLKPWLIMDDSFTLLQNAYSFRGRIRKRFGSVWTGTGVPGGAINQFFSRLSIKIGTTDGAGNIAVTVPGTVFKIGQAFTIGNEIFTVTVTGAPGVMLDTGAATVKTYNTTNGAVVINGAAALTDVYFYPAEPVMGLATYDKTGVSVNDQPAYAFDTQFAYVFLGGFWQRSGAAIWHGDNSNFFWTANWRGALASDRAFFVTNYFAVNPNGAINANDDPIWYTQDGTNWTAASGVNAFYYAPGGGAVHTGPYVLTARIIVPFKDRLVLLNTIEVLDGANNTQFVNRARYSHSGSPFATNAWYEQNQTDAAGNVGTGGGFIDAPTDEAIISAEFIKDRLIVYFERSTWELGWTANTALPFQWQKINTELGSEATFSTVPFDRHILTMGNVGVHACNGANVERIDQKIPDEIFDIRNKNVGVQRVAGIRDYFTEMVYWTFPAANQERAADSSDPVYPNQVLVYNYRNGAWALNDDSFTVFGYFNQQVDQTWANSTGIIWAEAAFEWDNATTQSQFRQVIAGNQEGWVFIIDADITRNAPSLQISQLPSGSGVLTLYIRDHNLQPGEYIALENYTGVTITSNLGFNNPPIAVVATIPTNNTVNVVGITVTGVYTGGGTVARVSNIQIQSKQFNPYVDQDRNVFIQRVDFGMTKTTNGEITVDYFPSSTELSMVGQGIATGSILGTSVLQTSAYATVPLEIAQERVWHPVYMQTDGECIQLSMYFSVPQIRNSAIAWSDFEMQGMVIFAMPTSYRLQ